MRYVGFGIWVLVLSTAWGRVGLSGERSRVVTKDGKTYEGQVTQGVEEIVIDQNGIKLRIKSAQVASITALKPPREEYRSRAAKLDAKDVRGHFALALWCRDNGLNAEAVRECETVLRLDRDHAQAKLLLRLAKRKMQERRKPREPAGTRGETGDEAATDERPGAPEAGLISAEDVQKLRFAELILPDPTNNELEPDKVSVRFKKRLLQNFWEEMQGREGFQSQDRQRFFRMRPIEQVGEIVRETGRTHQPDIEIRGDPRVFQEFRTRIWPIVRTGCAATNCHSGPKAAKFRLFTASAGGSEQLYTNFLILSTVSGKDGKVINRDRVEESLLLSYALPPGETDKPHPGVEIRPIFRSKQESRYRQFEDWIYLLLRDPNYGVKVPGQPGGNETGLGDAEPADDARK